MLREGLLALRLIFFGYDLLRVSTTFDESGVVVVSVSSDSFFVPEVLLACSVDVVCGF